MEVTFSLRADLGGLKKLLMSRAVQSVDGLRAHIA
jgi:hypothetical protein